MGSRNHSTSAAAEGSPPAVADTFYYEVLGLPPSALPEDVRKAYKRLALQFHPDKNSAADATRSFLLVSEAYACLSDPARRAEFVRGFTKIVTQPLQPVE